MTTRLMRSALIVALALTLPTWCAAVAAAKDGGKTEVNLVLKGSAAFPSARGKAKYQSSSTEQQLEIEAQKVNTLKGQQLAVLVAGAQVGVIVVAQNGKGSLTLSSQLGQVVPIVTTSTAVSVQTLDGIVVVSN